MYAILILSSLILKKTDFLKIIYKKVTSEGIGDLLQARLILQEHGLRYSIHFTDFTESIKPLKNNKK